LVVSSSIVSSWPVDPALSIEFDCISAQQRIRDITEDLEKDSAEFIKVKAELDKQSGRFVTEGQQYGLSQKSMYVSYIRKQMPANASQLKSELARARRYQCGSAGDLADLEARAGRAVRAVFPDAPKT
jgi:hypothetical protein